MHKKTIIGRLKVLSRPTGKPQWAQAARAIVLMLLAGWIAKFLGMDNGIGAVMFTTLIATIMMDISLPLRKVIPLATIGFLMAILAFTSASLGLNNVPIFIFFTVIWSFFALSTYIFGESVGFFGFLIFSMYFVAVIMVNNKSTTPEWAIYTVLAFLVASLLLIPRIWNRKQEIRKMVAVGFIPQSSLKTVLATRQALSGITLQPVYYELFRLGSYITGYRGYGKLLLNRISAEYQDKFKEYLQVSDETSLQIAESIIKGEKQVNLDNLDEQLSGINQGVPESKDENLNAFIDFAYNIANILKKSAEFLTDKINGDKLKISASQTSLREVLKANFNLNNMYIRHALRFTLAMTIGLLLVHLTHDRDAIWVTMGILIIIKPDITSTINNMILRLFFNLLAIILAIILGFIFPHQILLWLAFIMLFFFRAFFPTYMGLSVMALTIFVVFIWPTGTVFENAIARIIDITLGAIIAFICAYAILPSRVSVDLPGQVAKTIKANQEYMNKVLINPEQYNHEKAVQGLNKYLLEENNLQASIKKLQDFFTDISEDILIYQDLAAANHKLSADISALATLLEKETITDFSLNNQAFNEALEKLEEIIEKGSSPVLKSLNTSSQVFRDKSYIMKNLGQYLDWIVSDIDLLQEIVNTAAEKNIFKKYRDLS
ncbi:MAG: FUSC family protein [Methanobacterium sp.]|nr:FUSC family protein [Methanobacterium sp.]